MKTTGKPSRANLSASEPARADAVRPFPAPGRSDSLGWAKAFLLLAAVITILPPVFMTGDHFLRQKPSARHQQAVFRAAGLSTPCFFPAGHPARTRLVNPHAVDWRLAPFLPQAAPGTVDLVRPRVVPRGDIDHGR